MSNLEPVKIEILLRENIAKGLNDAGEAVKDFDSGFKRGTKNLKAQVAEQRQLIREITGDIKELTRAAKEATDPGAKSEILGDLIGARKALAEEQATLIGLQREQVDANGEEEKSNEGIIESLKNWAIGAATVGTAMSVFSAIVGSTRATADQFEFAMAGAKSGLDFFWKTLASGDWKDFFENMDRAIRTGRKYAEMMDEFKEANWSLTMKEADSLEKISELEDKLKNKGLSTAERKAAGDERIKIEEGLSAERTANAKIEHDADVLVAMDRTKLSEDVINNILKNISKEGKAKADQYNKDLALSKQYQRDASASLGRNDMYGAASYAAQVEKIAPNLLVSDKVKADAAELRKMGDMTDKMVEKYIDSYAKVRIAKDSAMSNIERVRSLVHSLSANEDKDGIKAKDAEGLDNRIKATRDQMDLVEDANSAEFAALAKKLVVLEAEKKLRQSIVDMQTMIANNQVIETKGAVTALQAIRDALGSENLQPNKTTQAKSVTDRLKKDGDAAIAKTKKTQEEKGKRTNKSTKEENEKLREQQQIREDILAAAQQLTEVIINNMDLTEGEAAALQGAMNVAGALAKGDYVGAAISGITTVVGALMDTSGLEESLTAPWIAFEDWVTRSNAVLERYIKLRDESIGSDRYSSGDAAIQLAKDNKAQAEGKINELKLSWTFKDSGLFSNTYKTVVNEFNAKQKEIGEGLLKQEGSIRQSSILGVSTSKLVASYNINQLTLDKAGNFTLDRVQKLIDDGVITDEAVINAVKEYNDNLDGLAQLEKDKQTLLTDTMAGNLADSISEGFKNGYSSAAEFADTFEGFIRGAIDNSLKILSEPALKKWYEDFAASMESGGGLDQSEKDQLKKDWDIIIANEAARRKAVYGVVGLDAVPSDTADATGMRGDIQRMTEETGSALGGNISAIRINMARLIESGTTSMTMLQKSLEYQLRTADNTDDMKKSLNNIDARLGRIELDGIKVI